MGLEHPLHLIASEQPTELWEVADICDQIYSYILGPICQEQKHHLQNAIDPQLFGFFCRTWATYRWSCFVPLGFSLQR